MSWMLVFASCFVPVLLLLALYVFEGSHRYPMKTVACRATNTKRAARSLTRW
jgi:hypothetical protein